MLPAISAPKQRIHRAVIDGVEYDQRSESTSPLGGDVAVTTLPQTEARVVSGERRPIARAQLLGKLDAATESVPF